jgi:translation initiation factor 1
MSRLFAGTSFDRPPRCETCGKPKSECRCLELPAKKKMSAAKKGEVRLDSGLVLNPQTARPPEDQIARIRVEKRKGNRLVTVITGLEHPGNDLPSLCTQLKQTLGTGGSVQGRTLELQGDHAEKVGQILEVDKGLRIRVG